MTDARSGIDPSFQAHCRTLYGPEGAAWVEALPAVIERLADRWSLIVGAPMSPLSYAYVVAATRGDGVATILKLAFPGREQRTEIEALRVFGGSGAVRLLQAEPDAGALLLERLVPGTTLRDVSDDTKATGIAADVMTRLWRPVPYDHGFPSVATWSNGVQRYRRAVDDGVGQLPADLVDLAEELFGDLLATVPAGGDVLLHGDLHHDNVLYDETRGWVAIDPKGVVGEPAYEAAALLRNPWDGSWALDDPVGTLDRRVDVLTRALGLQRDRIVRWAVASAVLSACWSIEDQDGGGDWSVRCAGWLRQLM